MFSFNSLSRDHGTEKFRYYAKFKIERFNSLSRDHHDPRAPPRRNEMFQLPLSGSPSFCSWVGSLSDLEFQLPLSGSRAGDDVQPEDSFGDGFNSLSRDHIILCMLSIQTRDNPFQLPLSGSLSPIPGFSGSPRLSAAAPLRTNES